MAAIKTFMYAKKYPYIMAYEEYMGAKRHYIQEQLKQAIDDNAPPTAYRRTLKGDGSVTYLLLEYMSNKQLQAKIFADGQKYRENSK